MRSEDRKPSKRVFPLLQNLDLDTVTFSNVQGVGDPITIEDMNEQELQDLVLVNLARLVVSGEWTGLLEAGGSDYNPTLPNQAIAAGSAENLAILNGYPPWGNGNAGATVLYGSASGNKIYLYPFVAPSTITVSNLEISISSAAASTCLGLMAFYNDNGSGAPGTLIGKTSVDVESTGVKVLTAFLDSSDDATDIDLTLGTTYWFAMGRSADSVAYSYNGCNAYARPMVSFASAPNFSANAHTSLRTISSMLAMPASFTMTDLEPHSLGTMVAGIN